MATIADVARRAGVSIATVSRVLSPAPSPHPVSARTAARVREAAQALDFVPSALARGLASRRSGLIGLIVRDLADPHYPHVAGGAEDAARRHGLAVLVCNTLGQPDRLADYLRLLNARHVDAIVLCGGSTLSPPELASLGASAAPVVLIGRPAPPWQPPFVSIDNLGAARAVTRHLVETGRRRIAHLAGPASQTTMLDRAAGYAEALAEAGLPTEVVETNASPADGLARARRLLRRPAARRPDAVFAATDRLALSVLAAAADVGLGVPRDLAVFGFDDLPLAPYVRPSLSSVTQPAHRLGREALGLALRLIDGARPDPVVVAAEIVVRDSSAPRQPGSDQRSPSGPR